MKFIIISIVREMTQNVCLPCAPSLVSFLFLGDVDKNVLDLKSKDLLLSTIHTMVNHFLVPENNNGMIISALPNL